MTYTKTNWTNDVPQGSPLKYKITGDSEGVLSASAQIELVTPVVAGTPLDAQNLNHIEDGIVEMQNRLDAGSFVLRFVRDAWQAYTVSSVNTLTYQTVEVDSDGILPDPTSGIITIPAGKAGNYIISASIRASGASMSYFSAWIEVNNGGTILPPQYLFSFVPYGEPNVFGSRSVVLPLSGTVKLQFYNYTVPMNISGDLSVVKV